MTRSLTIVMNNTAVGTVRRILRPDCFATRRVLQELHEAVSGDIQEVRNALLGRDSTRRGEQDGARQRKST